MLPKNILVLIVIAVVICCLNLKESFTELDYKLI